MVLELLEKGCLTKPLAIQNIIYPSINESSKKGCQMGSCKVPSRGPHKKLTVQCSETTCKKYFHKTCAGYAEEDQLHPKCLTLCAWCLKRTDKTVEDVLSSSKEMAGIDALLNYYQEQLVYLHTPMDGLCAFSCLNQWKTSAMAAYSEIRTKPYLAIIKELANFM